MTPAHRLTDSLATLRRQWRLRVVLEAAVWIALAVVAAIVVGHLVTTTFGTNVQSVRLARVIGYALVVGTAIRFLALPLFRRTSDERFALYVEERAPELRQALLSAVHELHAPVAERASPSLTMRLVERTLTLLAPLQRNSALERPRMVRATRALAAVLVAAAVLLAAGPAGLRQAARALFAPWSVAEAAIPVLAVHVVPGNAAVPRGASVDVGALLAGFDSDSAELAFRSDSTAEWIRLPMSPDKVDNSFTARLLDLTRQTDYFVESGGHRSVIYRLTVSDMPAVRRLALDIRYPVYTGLPNEHVEDGGDVAAVVGSSVTVRPSLTKSVRGAQLVFDDGTVVPLPLGTDSVPRGAFLVRRNGFYRVDLVATDGTPVAGSVQYAVDALPDRAPTVTIEQPGRDTKVTTVEEVTIAVRASDDYGVGSMELRYRVNGGDEQRVALADSGRRRSREPRAAHTLFLEEMKLAPGDLIAYHAVARDAAGNQGSSDVYFLEVRPFGKSYRQAEQQGGGGGGGGDSPDGLVARQRMVVAGTFNWLRDSATTSPRKRREDVAALNIAEGRLREDVASLVTRMQERGVARADTTFIHIQAELTSAITALQAAEERLVKAQGREALPAEQQALQRLQRAEALFRDVQVQFGGQQGGGGGSAAQRAEDLADLFELQTDKLRNQYEAVQQESSQVGQQAADSAVQRLRELAARQQQENERMQRLADAMRERLGTESGGGGGGASQRELARQAEEEARKLERLAREQRSPELAQAAQQLQQAADAMRKAAGGYPAQGNAALEQLGRAANGLEGARTSRVSESVRQLAQQAQALEQRQRAIAEGVKAMNDGSPAQRGERLRQLDVQKDALQKDVESLEANADRLAREGRREQPGAAAKVGEAADAMREQRVRDKIAFSKNVMRGSSADYANGLEGQIAENLGDIAGKLRAATNALGSGPRESTQARSLEQTRELVRGLESLRDRVADRTGAPGQESQAGQSGKQGQAQGQPQGQQQGSRSGGRPGGGNRPTPGSEPGAPSSLTPDDARQFSRELALRRESAEALRGELSRQGVDVGDLDRMIETLRQLERGRIGEPRGLEQLQGSVIEGLKEFEFSLYRRLGLAGGKGPSLDARAAVPEEYRAAVEEYYRSLAGARKR